MKKILSVVVLASALVAQVAFATEFTVDPAHSSIGFSIRHLVSHVKGEFKEFEGKINMDEKKPEASKVEFTVKSDSINTNNEKRDNHLKSEDFFDAKKFPTLSFVSKKVASAGKNKMKVTGDLTIHGVTKPATFNVEYNGQMKDPWGNMRAGYSATSKINRKDFGLTWNKALEAGGMMVGDDVEIALNVEAVKAPDTKQTEEKMKEADKKEAKKQ
jgi:polyisoprenoid-binding protein YceI